MNAIHTGRTNRVAAQTETGRAVDRRGEIHVGLSDEALADLAARSVYPANPQRPGGAFETVVLNANGGDAR